MAIDYIIDYDCIPKQTLGSENILNRLKGRERAQTIIRVFREHGDERSPAEMGFELSRNTPLGEEERQIIVVQELIEAANELKPYEQHCIGCPANRSGQPFGCMNFIKYPISGRAEAWLLNRLPPPQEPLIWLLLKQGVENFLYDGNTVKTWRENTDTFFEDKYAAARNLGEFLITANQVFEMMFTVGDIQPNHGGVLLLFFHAIPRDLEAQTIMHITPVGADADTKHPFMIEPENTDDDTIVDMKAFLHALYIAWKLNVRLLVDA